METKTLAVPKNFGKILIQDEDGQMPKINEALRFNQNKTRYDLLEPFAIEQLAKVFTKGAEKYAPYNWLKGMDWSKCVASLKRHIAAFERGEDFDSESGQYHMAHAAWNALAIVSYYKYCPQYDDRLHTLIPQPRIALDIDDVLADFTGHWSKTFNVPKPTAWQFDRTIVDKFYEMKANNTLDEFYMSMPALIKPEEIPFEPIGYVTSRPVDTKISEAWLDKHGFPAAPVYTVGISNSKVETLKKIETDIFVDDRYENYIECNKAGICTFLYTADHNLRYNVGFKRLKHLKDLI